MPAAKKVGRPLASPNAELLAQIDAGDLPEGYEPAKHQDYVDRRFLKLSPDQSARINQLWKEKQATDPNMPNRGSSFVKILAYVADEEGRTKQPAPAADPDPQTSALPIPHPVNEWKWSSETDGEGANRKAFPIKISGEYTIYAAPFDTSEDNKPPLVLLPESRLRVSGRISTAAPVLFGITIQHPNGDSAGRFLAERPADEFPDGEDSEVVLEFRDFHLDPRSTR